MKSLCGISLGHILTGGLGVLPQNNLKDVDAISRILVHFTIVLDLKLSPSFIDFPRSWHGLQLLTTITSGVIHRGLTLTTFFDTLFS